MDRGVRGAPALFEESFAKYKARNAYACEMRTIGHQVIPHIRRRRQIVDLGQRTLQQRESGLAHVQCASTLRAAGAGSRPSLRNNWRERSLPVFTHSSYSRRRS